MGGRTVWGKEQSEVLVVCRLGFPLSSPSRKRFLWPRFHGVERTAGPVLRPLIDIAVTSFHLHYLSVRLVIILLFDANENWLRMLGSQPKSTQLFRARVQA